MFPDPTPYLTLGLLTSILAFGVWVAGLTASDPRRAPRLVLGDPGRDRLRSVDGRHAPRGGCDPLMAIPAGLVTIGLLRAMAAGQSALAAVLLGGGQDEAS